MAKIDKEKLNKFKEVISLISESITRKEFVASFNKVLEFVKGIKEKNLIELSNIKKTVTDLFNKFKDENSRLISKALNDQSDGMNFIRDKVRRIKNGLDGKDGRNGIDGKDGVSGKDGIDGNNGSPDTPEQIADKLETLPDESRLKISAIDKLREELDELKNRPTGGGGSRKVVYTKRINLSSQCNGTLKEFTMPKDCIDVLAVYGTQFPITFDEADFTFEGNVLTLTSEVSAPATGQTLFALIQTLFYGKI